MSAPTVAKDEVQVLYKHHTDHLRHLEKRLDPLAPTTKTEREELRKLLASTDARLVELENYWAELTAQAGAALP